MDAWVGGVTGVYSRWRQDVPRFAEVRFAGSAGLLTLARADLPAWDGAEHKRWYLSWAGDYFAVIDEITDSRRRDKAINLHLAGPAYLAAAAAPSKAGVPVHVLTAETGVIEVQPVANPEPPAYPDAVAHTRVRVTSPGQRLTSAALFSAAYSESRPDLTRADDGTLVLRIGEQGGAVGIVLGNNAPLSYDGIRTDAAAMVIEDLPSGQAISLLAATEATIAGVPASAMMDWKGTAVQAEQADDGETLLRLAPPDAPQSGTLTINFPSAP